LYLSPEIINQERYSYATDAWSLGVMMYELAMLEPPFKGTNICQVAFKIVSAIPQPIDAQVYSEELRCLVDRLLDKEPQTRPTLDQTLLSPACAAAAEAASARHGLEWPPPAGPGTTAGQSGLVQKLRSQMMMAGAGDGGSRSSAAAAATAAEPAAGMGIDTTAAAAAAVHLPAGAAADEYEDDFEAWEDEMEEAACCAYDDDDDFEEVASGGGSDDASYDDEDFEDLSDDADEAPPGFEELSEEQVRQQLQGEVGVDGLAIAESLGVVAFLEGMRISAQKDW